ncbi:MAG: hypothetical protein WC831_04245 [Parcubacteria group bacterium]|jgi:hypothetical protein
MTKKEIAEEKELMLAQYKKYAPEVYRLLNLEMKISEYSNSLYNYKTNSEHSRRQELIRSVIEEKLQALFGEDFEKNMKINLSGGLSSNIADHHQILNNPLLISSNIISSVKKINCETKQDAIIVISSGDVPPNNYFSKNGFSFHDKRVPLFSSSERELCSYYIPKRDFDFVKRLKTSDRWKEFSEIEKEFLLKECDKIKSFDFSRCKNYLDQITVSIKGTWPFLFEEKLRKNLPDLIYLTQEEIVTECLVKLLEEKNIISEILFNPILREKVIENFRGIVVTWRESEMKGTHFFWRKYPGRDQSLRLYLSGNKLVPTDERFKDLPVTLEKEEILELLRKKEIYPSLFMIFMVLNYYSGVKPLVGYGSVKYLHLMKQAWKKTLLEFGDKKEVELLELVQTDGLVAGMPFYFQR